MIESLFLRWAGLLEPSRFSFLLIFEDVNVDSVFGSFLIRNLSSDFRVENAWGSVFSSCFSSVVFSEWKCTPVFVTATLHSVFNYSDTSIFVMSLKGCLAFLPEP